MQKVKETILSVVTFLLYREMGYKKGRQPGMEGERGAGERGAGETDHEGALQFAKPQYHPLSL